MCVSLNVSANVLVKLNETKQKRVRVNSTQ